jgi:hypothetical protein
MGFDGAGRATSGLSPSPASAQVEVRAGAVLPGRGSAENQAIGPLLEPHPTTEDGGEGLRKPLANFLCVNGDTKNQESRF